jgi:hypothetical protein
MPTHTQGGINLHHHQLMEGGKTGLRLPSTQHQSARHIRVLRERLNVVDMDE